MSNVIYRGPIAREPQTINLPVAGAYLPGIFVTSDGAEFTQAADSLEKMFILSNLRAAGQDIATAYAADDTGVGYRFRPDEEYNVRFAAGTYAKGDQLTVDATGRMAAAGSASVVIAFYDGDGATLAAGDFDDIVIANSYVVA